MGRCNIGTDRGNDIWAEPQRIWFRRSGRKDLRTRSILRLKGLSEGRSGKKARTAHLVYDGALRIETYFTVSHFSAADNGTRNSVVE